MQRALSSPSHLALRLICKTRLRGSWRTCDVALAPPAREARPVTGGTHRGGVEEGQPVTDRVDDRTEVGEGTPGRARAAGEQCVPAEQPALIGQVEADGAA